MKPEPITVTEFHKFIDPLPGGHPMLHEETEWWRAGSRVGAIIRDRYDNDWGYVTVYKNKEGEATLFDCTTSKPNIGAARKEMFESFKAPEKDALIT